ncbi:MAG: hypothetical protein MUE30_15310 [Spirosomaceae bacterium]|jgi:hypothetical protein|nr:hypothetical protein [Spirosomataceae bacterium]
MNFDFRQYHVRAINANSEAEKAAINQELKDLYETLNETEKVAFNEQLQTFLVSQYKSLATDYNALKDGGAFN